MEKPKYYTPDISEFHVGFEFQTKGYILDESTFPEGLTKELYHSIPFSQRIKKYPEVKANTHWYDCNWGVQSCYTDLLNVCYEGGVIDNIWVGEEVRVKHLDQEDIESLGFEFLVQGNVNNFTFQFKKDNFIRLNVAYGEPSKICVYRYGDDDWLPRAFIKNKSELKKILTQIGVL